MGSISDYHTAPSYTNLFFTKWSSIYFFIRYNSRKKSSVQFFASPSFLDWILYPLLTNAVISLGCFYCFGLRATTTFSITPLFLQLTVHPVSLTVGKPFSSLLPAFFLIPALCYSSSSDNNHFTVTFRPPSASEGGSVYQKPLHTQTHTHRAEASADRRKAVHMRCQDSNTQI